MTQLFEKSIKKQAFNSILITQNMPPKAYLMKKFIDLAI